VTAVAIKQEAIDAIQRLPDKADMEEIMYRLYVLESIRRGREDSARGDTTPAEDVIKEVQGW
jgi:predicted transcriptional regulator